MSAHAAEVTDHARERLSQLAAEYAVAKPAADAAREHLAEITAGIKSTLIALYPDRKSIRFEDDALDTPLQLTYSESWRLDSARMKRDDPETYVRYAKKSPSWTLRAVES